ncbi:MAG: DUF3291 domain-containing protein [Gammaproteobacteria bacterium]|nr:DUF3291 domain-containing protein [Gammaproteobacteria bacterium]
MSDYHLAQINIAQAIEPLDTPRLAGFVSRLDEINGLAEQSAGFIWRLVSDAGNATALRVFDHPDMLINMSVWQDLASLRAFVYRSNHIELLRAKAEWFEPLQTASQALWWLPAGQVPDIDQGKEKLAKLDKHGPSADAFTFAKLFDPPNSGV